MAAFGASCEQKNRLDVFYQLDEYVKSKSRKVTPGMVKVYLNMKALLLAFQEWTNQPITFESFDFNFYEEFVEEAQMNEHGCTGWRLVLIWKNCLWTLKSMGKRKKS